MESETFYKSEYVKCQFDGITRAVRIKRYRYNGSLACDTFFSCPANTRVKGHYAHGYVTTDDNGALEFRIHDASRVKLNLADVRP